MNSQTAFCPNLDCPARGQRGQGNIGIHSQKRRRYICRVCGQTFSERKGTAFYRLHRSVELVTLVITLWARAKPLTRQGLPGLSTASHSGGLPSR